MKQLLLNILFIVGSALIFIQGAKLFTNGGKISGNQSVISSNNNSTHSKHNKATVPAITTKSMISGNKNGAFVPFFKNSALPYSIMVKINTFYNPYLNLNDYGLVGKYAGEW